MALLPSLGLLAAAVCGACFDAWRDHRNRMAEHQRTMNALSAVTGRAPSGSSHQRSARHIPRAGWGSALPPGPTPENERNEP